MAAGLYRAETYRTACSIASSEYAVVGVVIRSRRSFCGVCGTVASLMARPTIAVGHEPLVQSARHRAAPCFVPIFDIPLVSDFPPRTGRLTLLALFSLTLCVCVSVGGCPSIGRCAPSRGYRPARGTRVPSMAVWVLLVICVYGSWRRASCVLAAIACAVWASGCVAFRLSLLRPFFTLLHTMAAFTLCIVMRVSGSAPRAVRVAPPC